MPKNRNPAHEPFEHLRRIVDSSFIQGIKPRQERKVSGIPQLSHPWDRELHFL